MKVTGKGTVLLTIAIHINRCQRREVKDVLFVLELSYNLLSVSRINKTGEIMKFAASECTILDGNKRIVATASLIGSLYHLNPIDGQEADHAAVRDSNEILWHRCYSHVGLRNSDSYKSMVNALNYQRFSDTKFYEPCIDGKCYIP